MSENIEASKPGKEGIVDSEPAKALELLREGEIVQDVNSQEANKKLRWKLDSTLLPLLCLTYALQSIDKTTLGYAAVFGLEDDLHLVGTEYSWLGAIFYLGYLIWEFPTNVLLQKLPINRFMSGTVRMIDSCSCKINILTSLLGNHLGHYTHLPWSSIQFCRRGNYALLPGCVRVINQSRHHAPIFHVLRAPRAASSHGYLDWIRRSRICDCRYYQFRHWPYQIVYCQLAAAVHYLGVHHDCMGHSSAVPPAWVTTFDKVSVRV